MSHRSQIPISTPEDKRKRAKGHVAVKQRREDLRVYAVQAPSQDDALAIVAASSAEGAAVEAAGRLSKKLARPLKLQPEVPRPV